MTAISETHKEQNAMNEAKDNESSGMSTRMEFINYYRCPSCGHQWYDVWSCQVNDDCPECGARHIEPHRSEDHTEEQQPMTINITPNWAPLVAVMLNVLESKSRNEEPVQQIAEELASLAANVDAHNKLKHDEGALDAMILPSPIVRACLPGRIDWRQLVKLWLPQLIGPTDSALLFSERLAIRNELVSLSRAVDTMNKEARSERFQTEGRANGTG